MFNEEKALQALSYIQEKTNCQDYIPLLKLVYFAERYSVRKYCITILDDEFYAMKNGPVASNTYNILKSAYNFRNPDLKEFVVPTGEHSTIIRYPKRRTSLSLSDIESLDFSISHFSKFKLKMIDISHYFPEWYKHEHEINDNSPRAYMSYLDFFEDPDKERLTMLKSRLRVSNDPYFNSDIAIAKLIFEGEAL